jgi:hypothetical protein
MILRFNAEDFMIFPPKIALWIIAHELAHVYQKAIGGSPGGTSEAENETDANRIAESWGFDREPRLIMGTLTENLSIKEAIKRVVELGIA